MKLLYRLIRSLAAKPTLTLKKKEEGELSMELNLAYKTVFPEYPDAVHIKEAADMLHIDRHTVGKLIREHQLFAVRPSRSYIIPKCSVIEFLTTGKSQFPEGLNVPQTAVDDLSDEKGETP